MNEDREIISYEIAVYECVEIHKEGDTPFIQKNIVYNQVIPHEEFSLVQIIATANDLVYQRPLPPGAMVYERK